MDENDNITKTETGSKGDVTKKGQEQTDVTKKGEHVDENDNVTKTETGNGNILAINTDKMPP